MRDSIGRERRPSQGSGRTGHPSKDGARTGRSLSLDPPKHLGKDGKEFYRWAVGMAVEMGFADAADASAFETAAETFQRMRQAQRYVKKYGMATRVVSREGETVHRANPALAVEKQCREFLRHAKADLGLSPTARAKFAPGAAQEQDPFEALLSG